MMKYDVIIVGAGIAGLTASAFLAKSGCPVLLLEKNKKTGGLVNSFTRQGFTFDGGIRATENSGVLFPMLKKLGIEMDFVKNEVSMGFKKDIIRLTGTGSLKDYSMLLKKHFRDRSGSIDRLVLEMEKVMGYMDVLYGIDNPIFLDLKKDRKYLVKVILPWIFRYLMTVNKIEKLKIPIEKYLEDFIDDPSLIDMIAQHFFKATPAFFALGYFKIYLDYYYPKGGTGTLVARLKDFILKNKGTIINDTQIIKVDPGRHLLIDQKGDSYGYKKLIWAADLRSLYEIADISGIKDDATRLDIQNKKKDLTGKKGGESVLTLYLCLDIDKQYFRGISSGHLFYTADLGGISSAGKINCDSKEDILKWLKKYLKLTTYEISIPVLRDSTLAPEGKTGLIVSTLFDFDIAKKVSDMGWYDEFKKVCEETIIDTLHNSIYSGIKDKTICQFSSTPLTLFRKYNNLDGAITGWAFTNDFLPVETKMIRIARTPDNPIPDVYQAGQWTYSPAGLPTAIMTGKMSSDKVLKGS